MPKLKTSSECDDESARPDPMIQIAAMLLRLPVAGSDCGVRFAIRLLVNDGRTHLAYKAEHVVELDSEILLAAEIRPADHADHDTLVTA